MQGFKHLEDMEQLRGKVLTFAAFINEKMDVRLKPNGICVEPDDDVYNAVGNKIEQICGWDLDVLEQYLARIYNLSKPSKKSVMIWLTMEVSRFYNNEISLTGEEHIKAGKEDVFISKIRHLDFEITVERLMRKLRGLPDESAKYPPTYVPRLADLVRTYCKEDAE